LRANGVAVTVFGGNLRFVSLDEGDGLAQPIVSARIGDLFRAIREQHVAIGAVAISVLAADELAKIVLGKFLRLAITLPFRGLDAAAAAPSAFADNGDVQAGRGPRGIQFGFFRHRHEYLFDAEHICRYGSFSIRRDGHCRKSCCLRCAARNSNRAAVG
jgi:hypothetical protein